MRVSMISMLAMGLVAAVACGGDPADTADPADPEKPGPAITVDRAATGGENIYVTFLNAKHPDNRIGYRFFEGSPRVVGKAPASNEEAGTDPAGVEALEKAISARPGAKAFAQPVSGEKWISHQWTYHMAPAEDGIDMLWVIETGEEGLPQHYAVTQCFRMSGPSYRKSRHNVALTPAFSEYDTWKKQEAEGKEKTSLTYVVRRGKWEAMPVGWAGNQVSASTPHGLKVGHKGDLDPADCGLFTRNNLEQTWICGIYWERTTKVACHWPADCLHPYVDIGNVPPKSKRAVRGKIYWFKGTKDDLLAKWRRDFPEDAAAVPQGDAEAEKEDAAEDAPQE